MGWGGGSEDVSGWPSAIKCSFRMTFLRLPWWSRVKRLPRQGARDPRPGPGRSPRPAAEQLSPNCHDCAACALELGLGNRRRARSEKAANHNEQQPLLAAAREKLASSHEDPVQPKMSK